MDKQDKKTLSVVTVAHTLVHLIEGTLPPLIPLLLGVFNTDYFHLGLVMSVFSYSFGLGAFPSGVLADRTGPTRLLILYLFGSGMLCVTVLFVTNLVPFAIVLGLLGLLGSIYHPAANTIISLGIKERGKAFGINGIAGSLGTSAVPFLAAFLGAAWGWRSPYLIFGVAVLVVGFFALSLPSYKTEIPSPKERKDDTQETDPTSQNSSGWKDQNTKKQEKVLTSRLVLFYLSCALAGMGNRGVLTFLPAYLGKQFAQAGFGLDPVRLGGIFATLTLIAGAAGQYIAGAMVDRRRPQSLYVLTLLVSALCILVMSFSGGVVLFLAAVGVGFFSFAVQPMQNTIVAKLLPKHRHGMGYGFMFFMTFGIGSIAAAFSGWLADRQGLPAVFIAMGLCYVASTLSMFVAERMEQKVKSR
ncbi:MAG: MFS transporter [Spirochaetales bacterium]